MSRRELRAAPFAVRFVRRHKGKAAIVYRRRPTLDAPDRLGRVATVSPLALLAGSQLLRSAKQNEVNGSRLGAGGADALDHDWGARLAVYGRITAGLRDPDAMGRAASHLSRASGAEAAWWLGMIERDRGSRVVRALRVLTEATA